MSAIRKAWDALLGRLPAPSESVPAVTESGLPVPAGAVQRNRKSLPLAEGPHGHRGLTVWHLAVPNATAEQVSGFYRERLTEAGWAIEAVEPFRNAYGLRVTALSPSGDAYVSVTIAKWPHEDFVAVSVYRYGA
jgi:hypothetical protein